MLHLQRLEQSGARVSDSFSDPFLPPVMPEGFNIQKFNRGKKFFQDNAFSCTFAMLSSLISGLSVINLLEPLVFTEQSNSPIKALRRYFMTFQHVLHWHYGNVWDPSSDAYKSISEVCMMHNTVRKKMMGDENNDESVQSVHLSQYDMSLVQCGFMGAIIMYPEAVGIQCTMEDLSDYCYFWYGIGYLLGINDENNICRGGLAETLSICKEIESCILLPSLKNPPKQFYPMAKALTDGMNLACRCRLFSVEAFLAISYSAMSVPCPKLAFVDYLRMLFLRTLLLLVKYVPFCKSLLNRLFTRAKPRN